MVFLSEAEPRRFAPIAVHPGIHRLVAPNAGPMTYHGTNTWLVEGEAGLTVIDPGPDDAAHIAAILAAGRIERILLTHTHPDHMAGAPALQAAAGAPILAWATPWAHEFTPDGALGDGERIGGLTALHTPGHASDHLCFARDDGVVFTGDHVMSWSTSVVSPPDGDMAAYMASLRRMLLRQDTLYLCGHGPPLPDPHKLTRGMLLHRAAREAAVLAALTAQPQCEADFLPKLYPGLDPPLARAAMRSVLAHLLKLQSEGKAERHQAGWVASTGA